MPVVPRERLLRTGGVALMVMAVACGRSDAPQDQREADPAEALQGADTAILPDRPDTVRVALFNIRELSLDKLNEGTDEVGSNPQLLAAAEIIRRIRPDILILNEIDHDLTRSLDASARDFAQRYLATGEGALDFPHAFAAPNNTGRLSGLDLNADGVVAGLEDQGTREYGDDSFGFGTYPGQYSMAVLSTFPIDSQDTRTFQRFRWKDLPGHHMPRDFYSDAVEETLRLSSKSHWDVPIQLPSGRLRLLLSHPTPPVFDGDEDRNGRRNFDEVGFWAAYLDDSPWIYDDGGVAGGFGSGEAFMVAGDLNARPDATDGVYNGIPSVQQLLGHPRLQDTGATLTARGGLDGRPPGPPAFPERATAVFNGGWRLDYLLPSTNLSVIDGGVFWPTAADDPEGARLAAAASDHRLIWLDVVVP